MRNGLVWRKGVWFWWSWAKRLVLAFKGGVKFVIVLVHVCTGIADRGLSWNRGN